MNTETNTITNLVKISTSKGDMVIELYPEVAPITVANFQKLVADKFYDGLIFHRIIAGFMIQGGDPQGTGMGGSKHKIKGEFAINGHNNTLSHDRGVISMARSMAPDSASSQFFICHANASFLDGQYASFGKLIEGEDVLDALATVQTAYQDRPVVEQVINSIRFLSK